MTTLVLETWLMPVQAVRLTEETDWEAVAEWCGGEVDLTYFGDDEDPEHRIVHITGCVDAAYLGQWIVRDPDGRTRVHYDRHFLSTFTPLPASAVFAPALPRQHCAETIHLHVPEEETTR